MRIPKSTQSAVKSLAGLLLLLSAYSGWANGVVGTVTHLQGTLSVQHADGSQALLALQSPILEKDLLTTEANTYARIKFADDSEAVLRPETSLSIENFNYPENKPENGNILLKLVKGGLRKVTGLIGHSAPDKDVLATPVATIGIRGTHYGLLFCQGDCANIPTATGEPLRDGLHLDVVDGEILVKNAAGEILVALGQFAYVPDANGNPHLVPPNEGVQITIPPAILHNSSNGKTLDVNHSNGQCTIQ